MIEKNTLHEKCKTKTAQIKVTTLGILGKNDEAVLWGLTNLFERTIL